MSSDELLADLASYSSDPLRFVLWAFPWGEPDGELADRSGPEAWQVRVLANIRDGLLTPDQAIQEAVVSGHGVGKSALVSWVILWSISTFEDTRGVVTANTETQLKTKTWAELGKWYRLFIAKEFFELTATQISARDPEHARTWRIDMVPWSERNMEAFAGLHNQGKRILVVMDEASAIPDAIHETTEGALTDKNTQIVWLMCGNPTRNTGRFKESAPGGRFASFWHHHKVDSREVSFTNKEQIAKWISVYQEDSDFVRVRVKGEFPRIGSMQFISSEVVAEAAQRDLTANSWDPLVMGVDVARFGDDASVIWFRKGRDAKSIAPLIFRGMDTMTLAGRVSEEMKRYRCDSVFVDGGGVGAGVVDRLRQLQVPVIEVQFGGKPTRAVAEGEAIFANKRAEMWGTMRRWLEGGAIPDEPQLAAELCAVEYGFNGRDEIQLERKEDMKKRGLASPDMADALALTFAYEVQAHPLAGRLNPPPLVEWDYDPFDHKWMNDPVTPVQQEVRM